MTKRVKIYIISSILPLLLLYSVAAYVIHPAKYVRRTYFFPDTLSREIKSLWRYIPSGTNRSENVVNYVKDLALGPHTYTYDSLIPDEGGIHSILYSDRKVFIDFERQAAFLEEGALSEETLELIKRNIEYNFPFVSEIYYTIDGQPVAGGNLETE